MYEQVLSPVEAEDGHQLYFQFLGIDHLREVVIRENISCSECAVILMQVSSLLREPGRSQGVSNDPTATAQEAS